MIAYIPTATAGTRKSGEEWLRAMKKNATTSQATARKRSATDQRSILAGLCSDLLGGLRVV